MQSVMCDMKLYMGWQWHHSA